MATFIRLMRHNVPVECAAKLFGVTHKTAFECRDRVLATVPGHRDRIVPRDTAWLDETHINPGGPLQEQLNVARVAANPRPGEDAQRVGQGRRARERGTQGQRERPGLPGADGDGERPVLLAQALPLALHGNVAAEPAGLPRLVRLPLPGQPGQGQMGPDRKGGAPYSDGRRDLPQLGVGVVSRVI